MRCAKSQKLYNMATVPLQICNGTNKCCKTFIPFALSSLFILSFLFSLTLRFLLSSPCTGSLSLRPVWDVHWQRWRCASPHSISPTLSHARSRLSHPEAAVDLTLFPLLFVHLSLCLSLVVEVFFFLAAIWVDLMVVVGCGLWAMIVAVVVGCGGDGRWWLSVLLMIMG